MTACTCTHTHTHTVQAAVTTGKSTYLLCMQWHCTHLYIHLTLSLSSYSLFAVVNHSGSLYNGHYTCYVRQQQDQVGHMTVHVMSWDVMGRTFDSSGISVMMPGSLRPHQKRCWPAKGKGCHPLFGVIGLSLLLLSSYLLFYHKKVLEYSWQSTGQGSSF